MGHAGNSSGLIVLLRGYCAQCALVFKININYIFSLLFGVPYNGEWGGTFNQNNVFQTPGRLGDLKVGTLSPKYEIFLDVVPNCIHQTS